MPRPTEVLAYSHIAT